MDHRCTFINELLTELQKCEVGFVLSAEDRTISVVLKGKGIFRLTHLPGNQWVWVSWDVMLNSAVRNQGLGKMLLNVRARAAKKASVTLLATVRVDNSRQRHLLKDWTVIGPAGPEAILYKLDAPAGAA